jgi:hypothetical protein
VRVKIYYKCQGYNHTSADCSKDKNMIKCKFCNQNHHFKECNKKLNPLCCPNCSSKNEKVRSGDRNIDIPLLDVNHAAHTNKCSLYLKEIEAANRKNSIGPVPTIKHSCLFQCNWVLQ